MISNDMPEHLRWPAIFSFYMFELFNGTIFTVQTDNNFYVICFLINGEKYQIQIVALHDHSMTHKTRVILTCPISTTSPLLSNPEENLSRDSVFGQPKCNIAQKQLYANLNLILSNKRARTASILFFQCRVDAVCVS